MGPPTRPFYIMVAMVVDTIYMYVVILHICMYKMLSFQLYNYIGGFSREYLYK